LEDPQRIPCCASKTLYQNRSTWENFSRPVPDILDGEEVYNVETILRHQRRGQSYQYLIKWEGYLISKASWEPEEAFSDDGNLLSLYKKQHQLWNVLHLAKHFEQPVLPTLPEKRVSDTEVLLLPETIDDILAEFDWPTHFNSNKNTFLETFMQRVDDWTTQYLNKRFIQ
jgi:hypothetical protein